MQQNLHISTKIILLNVDAGSYSYSCRLPNEVYENLKMALQLACAGDSSETTTAISKAVGCDHCLWWLHAKKPHLCIVVYGRKSSLSGKSRLSAGR